MVHFFVGSSVLEDVEQVITALPVYGAIRVERKGYALGHDEMIARARGITKEFFSEFPCGQSQLVARVLTSLLVRVQCDDLPICCFTETDTPNTVRFFLQRMRIADAARRRRDRHRRDRHAVAFNTNLGRIPFDPQSAATFVIVNQLRFRDAFGALPRIGIHLAQ